MDNDEKAVVAAEAEKVAEVFKEAEERKENGMLLGMPRIVTIKNHRGSNE